MRRCFEKREQVRQATTEATQVFSCLCLPPTRHHRQLVASLPESVRAAFPARPERLRAALENGTDWPGDGILWMAGGARSAAN